MKTALGNYLIALTLLCSLPATLMPADDMQLEAQGETCTLIAEDGSRLNVPETRARVSRTLADLIDSFEPHELEAGLPINRPKKVVGKIFGENGLVAALQAHGCPFTATSVESSEDGREKTITHTLSYELGPGGKNLLGKNDQGEFVCKFNIEEALKLLKFPKSLEKRIELLGALNTLDISPLTELFCAKLAPQLLTKHYISKVADQENHKDLVAICDTLPQELHHKIQQYMLATPRGSRCFSHTMNLGIHPCALDASGNVVSIKDYFHEGINVAAYPAHTKGPILETKTSHFGCYALSEDGQYHARALDETTIAVHQVEDDQEVLRYNVGYTGSYSMAFSPDSKNLMITKSSTGTVILFDLNQPDQPPKSRKVSDNTFTFIDSSSNFSPDGRFFFVRTMPHFRHILCDTRSLTVLNQLPYPRDQETDNLRPVFSPDSRFLAFYNGADKTTVIDLQTNTKHVLNTCQIHSLTFGSTGSNSILLYLRSQESEFTVQFLNGEKIVMAEEYAPTTISSSSDGRFCATSSTEGIIKLYDLDRGKTIQSFSSNKHYGRWLKVDEIRICQEQGDLLGIHVLCTLPVKEGNTWACPPRFRKKKTYYHLPSIATGGLTLGGFLFLCYLSDLAGTNETLPTADHLVELFRTLPSDALEYARLRFRGIVITEEFDQAVTEREAAIEADRQAAQAAVALAAEQVAQQEAQQAAMDLEGEEGDAQESQTTLLGKRDVPEKRKGNEDEEPQKRRKLG